MLQSREIWDEIFIAIKLIALTPPILPFDTSKWTISDQKSRQNRNKPRFMQVRKKV